jgi:hypothetical protein
MQKTVAAAIALGVVMTGVITMTALHQGQAKNSALHTGSRLDDYAQQKERFQALVYEQGPQEALAQLETEALKDPQISALCHDLLHGIGSASYEKTANVTESLRFNSSYCNSGYLHGVFESYFKKEQPTDQALAALCDVFMQETSFKLWQCLHGMGHGFMYLTNGDLDESLALCAKILPEAEASACHNGSFMEAFNAEILPKEQDLVDQNDPFSTCNTRDAEEDCYLYVPSFLSQTGSFDFSNIFHECKKAGEMYKKACIRGVGSEAIKRNMENIPAVFELCTHAGSFSESEACMHGLVSTYLNQKGSYAAGEALCAEAPFLYRSICTASVESKKVFFEEF